MIVSKELLDSSQLRLETNCLKYQIIIGFLVMLISNLHFIRKLSYISGSKQAKICYVSSLYQFLDHNNFKSGFYQKTSL